MIFRTDSSFSTGVIGTVIVTDTVLVEKNVKIKLKKHDINNKLAFILKVNICSCNRIPTLLVVLVLVTNPVIVVYRKLAQSNISIIFLT